MMDTSMEPQRVPMGTPSRGVKPMEVSMDLPPSMAQTEEPLPTEDPEEPDDTVPAEPDETEDPEGAMPDETEDDTPPAEEPDETEEPEPADAEA